METLRRLVSFEGYEERLARHLAHEEEAETLVPLLCEALRGENELQELQGLRAVAPRQGVSGPTWAWGC